MKKILVLISVLIFSTTAYANNRLDGFNKWLFENGYSKYVKKVESAPQYVRLSLGIAICGITTNVTNLNMKIILK